MYKRNLTLEFPKGIALKGVPYQIFSPIRIYH
jgi:hypothetical protein